MSGEADQFRRAIDNWIITRSQGRTVVAYVNSF